jgi:hypothetical protein
MNRVNALLWCDRVMYYSLLPVAFFLPISTAVVETGASFCITAFFIKRMILFSLRSEDVKNFLGGFMPVPRKFIMPALVFFLATLLSVLFSQFPQQSWKGFFGKTVEAVVLFFSIVECVNSRKRLNCFLSIFAFSALFVSFDGIWQHF